MGAMKTSLLVSALTVLSLLVVSSASGEKSGSKDPPPTDQGQTLGPGDETKRLQVSTGAMVAVQRRLALIEELTITLPPTDGPHSEASADAKTPYRGGA